MYPKGQTPTHTLIVSAMTEDGERAPGHPKQPPPKRRRRRSCFIALCVVFLILLLLLIIALILALTVFKPKQPRTRILSATVQGVAPRISLPALDIQLNITLNLQLLVENRNRVTFKHGPGKSLLLYLDKQVGEADLPSGTMPARGSANLPCRLTLRVDEFASGLGALARDISAGHMALETRTRIPGRIVFLGIFKKHVVATSECQLTVGFPSMKVQTQDCKSSTKF